jgi:hypothetical protein
MRVLNLRLLSSIRCGIGLTTLVGRGLEMVAWGVKRFRGNPILHVEAVANVWCSPENYGVPGELAREHVGGHFV